MADSAARWRSGACCICESVVAAADATICAVKILGGTVATAVHLRFARRRDAAIGACVTSLALALATIGAVQVCG
jgi:hypothetical protein